MFGGGNSGRVTRHHEPGPVRTAADGLQTSRCINVSGMASQGSLARAGL